ncbi:hypothetical protein [Microcystis aeruginosa]|nr:hypothetical protein [Microcystis aeruginosa]
MLHIRIGTLAIGSFILPTSPLPHFPTSPHPTPHTPHPTPHTPHPTPYT